MKTIITRYEIKENQTAEIKDNIITITENSGKMNFSDALDMMKSGKKVIREGIIIPLEMQGSRIGFFAGSGTASGFFDVCLKEVDIVADDWEMYIPEVEIEIDIEEEQIME